MYSKRTLVLGLLVLCLISQLAVAQHYTITDLGPLSPTAINAWGQVVGNLNGHAFMWTKFGGLRDLGLLPGATFSTAAAINDSAVVTGTSDGPGTLHGDVTVYCTHLAQPYAWNALKGMRALGVTLFDGEIDNVFSTAACYLYDYSTGINVLGHVVGADRNFGDDYRFGFLWRSSSSVKVFFDFQTIANGINDKDQVVGQTGGGDLEEASKAILWDNGYKTYLDTNVTVVDTEFSPRDSYCIGANGINDFGQVVGWSNMGIFQCPEFFFVNPQGVVHAFVWKAGTGMQDLGTLPGDTVSVARKISLFGQVIGSSGSTLAWQDGPPEGGGSVTVIGRPFIWSDRSGMRDLNSLVRGNSRWVLTSATDINVWGQIVGQGMLNGQPHGFLLTPRAFFKF